MGKKNVFDFGDFDTVTKSNEGVWIPLINPTTGEETDTEFLMLGYDSKEYTAWRDEQSKKSQQYMISQMAKVASKKKTDDVELELEDDISLLCILTKDWKNAEWSGQPLDFTQENVRMVYEKNAIARNQMRRAIDERERFFMVTSKS